MEPTHDPYYPEAGADVLTGFEPNLVLASTGKRLLNYIIDVIGFYAFAFVVSFLLALLFREAYAEWLMEQGELVTTFLFLLIYFFYLSLQEGLLKGRTLGKLCTGSRAVREDGGTISFGTALLRTVIRFVPFEAFSTLGGRPWHDTWSKTYVIDVRKSYFPPAA